MFPTIWCIFFNESTPSYLVLGIYCAIETSILWLASPQGSHFLHLLGMPPHFLFIFFFAQPNSSHLFGFFWLSIVFFWRDAMLLFTWEWDQVKREIIQETCE